MDRYVCVSQAIDFENKGQDRGRLCINHKIVPDLKTSIMKSI